MLTDAAQVVAQRNMGAPVKENPKISEAKLHLDELRTQIDLLKARLVEQEAKVIKLEEAAG